MQTTSRYMLAAFGVLLCLLPEVTCFYQSGLVLNFLCDSREMSPYVRDNPWDCSSYVVCHAGRAMPNQCPADKLFGGVGRNHKCLPASVVDHSRCHSKMFRYAQDLCRANPKARIPSPESCSQYFDCANTSGPESEFVNYLLECPYPNLFSPETSQCQYHSFVRCRHRDEPKAPCEYLQYMQLYDCNTRNCTTCTRHHPSCIGLSDGSHMVANRTDILVECSKERTINILTCPSGYSFSQDSSHSCIRN